ncbi:hypothetical protein [Streptomyces sp. NPDC088766]|uniref:hypothetical protein n=1 Tax=Streptomyces sp. NPDC088766 TaxID=3365893 RepID=UPI00381E4981
MPGSGTFPTHRVKDEDGTSPGSVSADSRRVRFDPVGEHIAEQAGRVAEQAGRIAEEIAEEAEPVR